MYVVVPAQIYTIHLNINAIYLCKHTHTTSHTHYLSMYTKLYAYSMIPETMHVRSALSNLPKYANHKNISNNLVKYVSLKCNKHMINKHLHCST